MPMHTIRTFFAIELPALTLKQIEKEFYDLKKLIPRKIKWAGISSMHITVKFIGDFNPEHQPSIQRELQSHLSGYREIKLPFRQIGVFPNLRNPRVVWLGLNVPRQLIDLAQIVNFVTNIYDYPQEKRNFSPHITIGRVRNNVSSRDRELVGQMIADYRFTEIDPFITNSLSFIKSSLTPKGPEYSTLFEISL